MNRKALRTWPQAALLLTGLLLLSLASSSRAGVLPGDLAAKLDPRLLPAILAGAGEPVSVWVAFRDKGEQDPADLARRLAEAEAALTPRARARRLRAHVTPLVDYLDLPLHEPYVQALQASGLAPYAASRWFNRVAVRASADRLASLATLPFVSRLEPVERGVPIRDLPAPAGEARVARPSGIARVDLSYGLSASQLAQIGVPALHDSGYTGQGVLICMLDDGFNYWNINPALAHAASHVIATRDFVRGTLDPTDTTSTSFRHGLWTWSFIAGYQPGRYLGAAFDAEFMLGRTEYDPTEHMVEMVYWGMGAEWADSAGADLISSSLGYNIFDPPDTSYTYADMNGHTTIVSRAAEIAASKGLLVVNSAGNEGCSSPSSCWYYVIAPADVNGDSLIAVGAVDANGNLAPFSSRGPTADGRIKPDLVARGVTPWYVAAADTGYQNYLSGTSFSCPFVSGLAACLMQAQPSWPATAIIRALRFTASKATTPDNLLGYGLPDGGAALQYIRDTASVPGRAPLSVGLRLTGVNPLTASSPQTSVLFGVGLGAGEPALRVLDAQGRMIVSRLRFARIPAGPGEQFAGSATWDGSDDEGRTVAPGVYFITLEAGDQRATVRVVSLR